MEDNNNENKKQKFGFSIFKFFKKDKNETNGHSKKTALIIAFILFVIVLVIFITSFKQQGNGSVKKASNESVASSYHTELENRLVNILNSVSGVSNAKVFISLSSSPEIIYAQDITENDNGSSNIKTSSIVFSKAGTQITPCEIKINYPKILGVLIVAKGVSDVKTKMTLTNCIGAVLNVPISCVEILEGK